MPQLSAVVITRDAADRLGACLDSLGFADEILVYDGGSRDASIAIARAHGVRVARAPDWQGFGVQRRRAQAETRYEWILMIDSDERVGTALAGEIRAAVDGNQPHLAYALPRRTWAFGRYLHHGGWWPDPVVRLYHREQGHYAAALVHEKVVLDPQVRVRRLKSPLYHHTYRNLNDYLVKSAHYASVWAETRDRNGDKTSLTAGLGHGLGCFLRMYLLKAGFLDGRAGLLLALLSAHSTFVKYADLWLRQNDPGPPEKTP